MRKREVATLVETLAQIKKDMVSEIRSSVQTYRRRMKNADMFYLFLQESLSYGYVPDFCPDDSKHMYPWLTVNVSNLRDFAIIHKIVGVLEQANIQPLKDDARCRKVLVTLRPKDEKFNFIRFTFERKLPRGSKCKVVKQVRENYSVVCER